MATPRHEKSRISLERNVHEPKRNQRVTWSPLNWQVDRPVKLAATDTVKADMKKLDRLSHPGLMAPAARLTIEQLEEVQRLAGLRLNLAQIGIHLRIDEETWEHIVQWNPAVKEVYQAGVVGAVIEHAEALQDEALVKREVGAIKFWLERHGGPQWSNRPVKVEVAAEETVVGAGPVIDVASSVGDALARQQALLERQTGGSGEEEP